MSLKVPLVRPDAGSTNVDSTRQPPKADPAKTALLRAKAAEIMKPKPGNAVPVSAKPEPAVYNPSGEGGASVFKAGLQSGPGERRSIQAQPPTSGPEAEARQLIDGARVHDCWIGGRFCHDGVDGAKIGASLAATAKTDPARAAQTFGEVMKQLPGAADRRAVAQSFAAGLTHSELRGMAARPESQGAIDRAVTELDGSTSREDRTALDRLKTARFAAGLQNFNLVNEQSKQLGLAQIARHEANPAAADQTFSLVASKLTTGLPSFQDASPATQSALLAAQERHLGDEVFSKALQSLAWSPDFQNIGREQGWTEDQRNAAQARAIGLLDQAARSPAYQGSDENKKHILANTANVVTSRGFQNAKPDVQNAMLAAVQNHITDGVFGNALNNLINSPDFAKLSPDRQSKAIEAFGRVADSETYRSKPGKARLLANAAKAVTSQGFQSAQPDAQKAMLDALQKPADNDNDEPQNVRRRIAEYAEDAVAGNEGRWLDEARIDTL